LKEPSGPATENYLDSSVSILGPGQVHEMEDFDMVEGEEEEGEEEGEEMYGSESGEFDHLGSDEEDSESSDSDNLEGRPSVFRMMNQGRDGSWAGDNENRGDGRVDMLAADEFDSWQIA